MHNPDLGWTLAALCPKPGLDAFFSLLRLTPIGTTCHRTIVAEDLGKECMCRHLPFHAVSIVAVQ